MKRQLLTLTLFALVAAPFAAVNDASAQSAHFGATDPTEAKDYIGLPNAPVDCRALRGRKARVQCMGDLYAEVLAMREIIEIVIGDGSPELEESGVGAGDTVDFDQL